MSDTLLEAWRREEAAPFSGWDFAHITSRHREESAPWSYEEIARDVLRGAASALDLGTGGGEVLSRLGDAFPRLMVAAEGYHPNVTIAHRALSPQGAHVVACGVDPDAPTERVQDRPTLLPFRDACVDVVLSRHEAYDADDVFRVLRSGGSFLTQQVGGRSYGDLLQTFGLSPQWPDITVENLRHELVASGFVIDDSRSWRGSASFGDVGAIVYYLKAVPWMVPGFSVDRYADTLQHLQVRLERDGELRFGIGRLLIRAHRPT